MANPKERTKKSSVPVEIQEEVQPVAQENPERIVSPLDEVMSQAEKAYTAYMEAERQVARVSQKPQGYF